MALYNLFIITESRTTEKERLNHMMIPSLNENNYIIKQWLPTLSMQDNISVIKVKDVMIILGLITVCLLVLYIFNKKKPQEIVELNAVVNHTTNITATRDVIYIVIN